MSLISSDDYQHAQKVWKEFRIHNLGDYHDLYLRTDVVLHTNVYKAFRETCLEHYKLDPVHFYTSPELAWKACLKYTGIILKLLTDPDMLLMFERGIRGGITQAVHKYAAANNPHMGDKFDPNKDTTYLQYLDANNLYGWAMSQPLPTRGFRLVDVNPNEISELATRTDQGYILEVDVMHQSIPNTNIPPGQPPGFCTLLLPRGWDLYLMTFPGAWVLHIHKITFSTVKKYTFTQLALPHFACLLKKLN